MNQISQKDFLEAIEKVGDIQYSQYGQSVHNARQAAQSCFELAQRMREDFAVWYSGMDREKVKRAIEMYERENKDSLSKNIIS